MSIDKENAVKQNNVLKLTKRNVKNNQQNSKEGIYCNIKQI